LWISADPLQEKYPNVSTFSYCANNPVNVIDTDGRKLKPSESFLNSSYGVVYKKLLSNNAYMKIAGKYAKSNVNDIKYNFSSGNCPSGYAATTITGKTITAHKSEKPISTYLSIQKYYEGSLTSKEGSTITEIGMARQIIHEGVHSYISVVTGNIYQSADHNTFMSYQSMIFDALKEYSTTNNMGFTDEQLIDLSYSGLPENNKQLHSYIQEFADKNGTNYQAEKEAFDKRVSDMVWEKNKIEEKEEKK